MSTLQRLHSNVDHTQTLPDFRQVDGEEIRGEKSQPDDPRGENEERAKL